MVVFWALNFIIGKIALREFPALLAAGLRTTLAGLFILPVFLLDRVDRSALWKWNVVRPLLAAGVCGVALNQAFFMYGLGRTSVAHASLLIGLTPILVLLIAALVGEERITPLKLLGMGVALGGVFVLQVLPAKTSAATLWGDVCVFLGALTFAMFTILGKRLTPQHGSVTVITFAYVGGAVALAPLTLWQGAGFDFTRVSAQGWLSLVYMAVFPSVLCYLIYYYALTHIAASRVAAFSYLQPPIAMLLAVPLLGEPLTATLATGGVLVLGGVYLTERG